MTRSDDVNIHIELDVEQEPDPPDTGLAVLVSLLLIQDLRDHLLDDRGDGVNADLLVRCAAVLAVLRRVRNRLGD